MVAASQRKAAATAATFAFDTVVTERLKSDPLYAQYHWPQRSHAVMNVTNHRDGAPAVSVAAPQGDKYDKIYAKYANAVGELSLQLFAEDDAAGPKSLSLPGSTRKAMAAQQGISASPRPNQVTDIAPTRRDFRTGRTNEFDRNSVSSRQQRSSSRFGVNDRSDYTISHSPMPKKEDPPEERQFSGGRSVGSFHSARSYHSGYSGREGSFRTARSHLSDLSQISTGGTDDISSRLGALTARSRALRGMTASPPSSLAMPSSRHSSTPTIPDGDASVFLRSSNSPRSVVSLPVESSKYSPPRSYASIDSRLEYLTKQSLALRSRAMSASGLFPDTSPAGKRVTFEADYVSGANLRGDRSVQSTGERSALSAHSAGRKSFNSQLDEAVGGAGPTTSAVATKHAPGSLAMRILSEKILDGYAMTRERCQHCGMAMLTRSGGSIPASLTIAECAFCPISNLRKTIAGGVAKQVMATKILSGMQVCTPTGSNGGLCTGCGSPGLKGPDGATKECQVCPVLDDASIKIVREQGRGGSLQEMMPCADCGSPQMSCADGVKCVVCEVIEANTWSPMQSTRLEYVPYAGAQHAAMGSPPALPSAGEGQAAFSNPVDHLKSSFQLNDTAMTAPNHSTSDQHMDMTKFGGQGTLDSSKQISRLDVNGVIVKSPSITSGDASQLSKSVGPSSFTPETVAKLKDQLREALARPADQSQTSLHGERDLEIAHLKEQLRAELTKAQKSQLELQRSLQHGSEASFASGKSRDELRAELDKAKEAQLALEKIIDGTKDAAGVSVALDGEDSPSRAHTDGTNTVELLAIAANNISHVSVSQQEVDATGHPKEHIPPPSFFQHSRVPSVVIVPMLPENANDCADAASYHTLNLKRSERHPNPRYGMDCCGASSAVGDSDRRDGRQIRPEDDYFDYDTIETDDDFTLDGTWNTMELNTLDGSRFGGSVRSRSTFGDRYQVNPSKDVERSKERPVATGGSRGLPSSSVGRCLFSCFGCGGTDYLGTDVDAYSVLDDSQGRSPQQLRPYSSADGEQFYQMNDSSIQRSQYLHHHSGLADRSAEASYGMLPQPKQSEAPPQPLLDWDTANSSDSSMRRVTGGVNAARSAPSAGLRPVQPSSRHRSPSRQQSSANTLASVQSDLTEDRVLNSRDRKVTFVKGMEQRLGALVEEQDGRETPQLLRGEGALHSVDGDRQY